jgi:hypothetical protein
MATNTTKVVTQYGGVKTGMTALAGGAAPSAAANTLEAINVVSTVATDGDSVILPAGMPQGTLIWVFNQDAAQDIHVFPNTGGTVNGGTATTGDIAVGQTQAAVFVQVGTDGLTWLGLYGAVFAPV